MTAAACPAIFYADNAQCVTFWQNIAIVESRGTIDVAHMLMLERAYQTLASRFSGGIVSCVIVQPGTPVSPPDALRESARFMKELGPAMIRLTVVIEDVGVAAQVFRTLVRGINVVIRDNKMTVHSDVASAIDSLASLIVPPTDEMDVVAALTAVFRTARARFMSIAPPSLDAPHSVKRKSWPTLRG